MCVILHKPAGIAIPEQLLIAAASLNRDGWGLMGFDDNDQLLVERHERVDIARILEIERRYRNAEYVLHLRMLTRGSTHEQNLHPLSIGKDSLLMHNGTLEALETPQCGRSDSWHLASEVLQPLLARDAKLLEEPSFRTLIELALGPQNKAVLLHRPTRRIHIFNKRFGAEVEGLWASSTRWIDQRLYHLPSAPQAQERSLPAELLHFI